MRQFFNGNVFAADAARVAGRALFNQWQSHFFPLKFERGFARIVSISNCICDDRHRSIDKIDCILRLYVESTCCIHGEAAHRMNFSRCRVSRVESS